MWYPMYSNWKAKILLLDCMLNPIIKHVHIPFLLKGFLTFPFMNWYTFWISILHYTGMKILETDVYDKCHVNLEIMIWIMFITEIHTPVDLWLYLRYSICCICLVATFQLHHVQQLLLLLKHHLFQHNFVPAGEIMQTLVHASDIVPDTCRNVC